MFSFGLVYFVLRNVFWRETLALFTFSYTFWSHCGHRVFTRFVGNQAYDIHSQKWDKRQQTMERRSAISSWAQSRPACAGSKTGSAGGLIPAFYQLVHRVCHSNAISERVWDIKRQFKILQACFGRNVCLLLDLCKYYRWCKLDWNNFYLHKIE